MSQNCIFLMRISPGFRSAVNVGHNCITIIITIHISILS